MRERLDVLDEDPGFERPPSRRLRLPTAGCVDERRLLTGDEPIRDEDEIRPFGLRPFPDRALDRVDDCGAGSSDADRRLPCTDEPRRDRQSVEDEMRVVREQHCVLRTRRLTLGAVCDDGGTEVACDGCKLHRRRERRAASAGEAARLDLGDQCLVAPIDMRKLAVARNVRHPVAGAAWSEQARRVCVRIACGCRRAHAATCGSSRLPGRCSIARVAEAATTIARHANAVALNQTDVASLPIPTLCAKASGQERYASQ